MTYLRDARDKVRREMPAKGRATPPPAPPPAGSRTGAQIILDDLRNRYKPDFKVGSAVHCKDGRVVPMAEGCAVLDSALIKALESASDAPRYKGEGVSPGPVNRNALPAFFRAWSKVSWGDLLRELPDEDAAELGGDAEAAEEFRRLVREALLTEVTLGGSIAGVGVSQVERRSVVDWCDRFAKAGDWKGIRSKMCWCRIRVHADGELELMVAVRHELFAQLKADRRLTEMGAKRFARRCARYGVGKLDERERPCGRRAVVLDRDFVADLVEGLPGEEDGAAGASPEG
jgi:hypothetical protein